VAFRVWLKLLDAYSDDNALALYTFTPMWKSVLNALVAVIVMAPETHYMVPAFIWMLVTFRRGDWRQAFGLQPVTARSKPAKHSSSKK